MTQPQRRLQTRRTPREHLSTTLCPLSKKAARFGSHTRWWGVTVMAMTVATTPYLARAGSLSSRIYKRASRHRQGAGDAREHVRLAPHSES